MEDLPIEYFRVVANQLVFISVFLGGICAAILGTLFTAENDTKIFKAIIIALSFAAVSFIVAVFGMNKVLMIITPGSPYEAVSDVLDFPRLVGGLAFYLGIVGLITVISLSGWLRNKKIGIFTTIIGIAAFYLIFRLT